MNLSGKSQLAGILKKHEPEILADWTQSQLAASTLRSDLMTEADSGLVRIALENLLRNAWKFTRPRARARIEVGVREGQERAFYVKDDGVGFDPAFADRLFQPFQRLHGASEFEGTGIGLAIVGRIAGAHGGRAWAESTLGEGACFCFTLAPRPRLAMR